MSMNRKNLENKTQKRLHTLDAIHSLLTPFSQLQQLAASTLALKSSALEEADIQALGQRFLAILDTEEHKRYSDELYQAIYQAGILLNHCWSANIQSEEGLQDPMSLDTIPDGRAIVSAETRYHFDLKSLVSAFERRPGFNPLTNLLFNKRDLENFRQRAALEGIRLRLPAPPAALVAFVEALGPQDEEGRTILDWRIRMWAGAMFLYSSIKKVQEPESSYSLALATGIYNSLYVIVPSFTMAKIAKRDILRQEEAAIKSFVKSTVSILSTFKGKFFKDPLLASLPPRPKAEPARFAP